MEDRNLIFLLPVKLSLKGEVILMKNVYVITGGSSGIGLEIAKNFKDGVVLITGRNQDKLDKAEKELLNAGIEVATKTSDISKRETIKELFEYGKSLGKIKTIINSAGVSGVGVDVELTFAIDLTGTQNLIEESLEILEEGTTLILISSMMGHIVPDGDYDKYLQNPSTEGAIESLIEIADGKTDVAYNFSKKGVQLMAKRYAPAFGEKGGRILSVSPGIIMTPMAEAAAKEHPEQMNYMKSMTPMGRNGTPEDIANAVSFLADDKASFITGTDLIIDGGLTVKLPEIIKAKRG